MKHCHHLLHRLPGLSVCLLLASSAQIVCGLDIRTELVATSQFGPTFFTHAPGDVSRAFIVGKTGQIELLNRSTNTINSDLFLDLSGQLVSGGAQGLLGMAFHPDYQSNGYFYLNMSVASQTGNNFDQVIKRYSVSADKNIADASSGQEIFRWGVPNFFHSGGWIDFGPNDDYLYIATGDGFEGEAAAQFPTSPLGKILRIDVNRTDKGNYGIPDDNPFYSPVGDSNPADDETWAVGLRHPWRSSFDRATGDLYMADVGDAFREEISFQHADNPGGANYGWWPMEGALCHDNSQSGGNPPCDDPSFTAPVYDYVHGDGVFPDFTGDSVTGGYVYRGPIAPLQGKYIFGDFISNQFWSFEMNRETETMVPESLTNWTDDFTVESGNSLHRVATFGEDALGNLYILSHAHKKIFRVTVPEPATFVLLVSSLLAVFCRRETITTGGNQRGATRHRRQ